MARCADQPWRIADGIPYLAPEVQLLYKARNPRPKDEIDFAVILPMLTQSQRQWLTVALKLAYGPGHAWLGRLNYAENVC